MEIWPAIDLRGGKCVRLQQGDYARETVFGDDPAAMARHWVSQGAQRLHLVDLDGARDGKSGNRASISAILAAVTVPCQVGGGVRDEAVVADLLGLGVARVIVGTQALKDPEWFRAMCRKFPGRVALGIDARNGMVATAGWLETSHTPALDLARQFASEPVAALIFTDIAKDGMLAGANVPAMAEMQRAMAALSPPIPVIASGGVTTVEDVRNLAAVPMAGAIVGRAIYEGRLTLADALAASG